MAWNKGTLAFLADPRQEVADKTGKVLTGVNLRPTLTGWMLIVKVFDPVDKKKQVLFMDSWTVEEVIELFYNAVVMEPHRIEWRDDKF